MKVRVCITTMTPELAYDAANHALDRATGPIDLMVVGNCCRFDSMRFRLRDGDGLAIREFLDNEGVVPAMDELWRMTRERRYGLSSHARIEDRPDGRDDIMCFIHDDCRILEHGWDGRVVSIMSTQPDCDCIGLVGGTGIGADDIYRSPYQTIQLGRHNVHSAMVDAEAHGRRATGPMRIATADGCALFVRRSFLDQLGGWSSWWPEPNHGYDNALACMLRRHGRAMWLLPVVFEHPSSLKLSLPPEFRNEIGARRYDERFGGDQKVHADAHRRLYETFRDVLPFHV